MAPIAAMLILAHQGGWDEILFVLAPLLVFGGLLVMARKRVDQIEQDEDGSASTPGTSEDHEGADPT